VSVTIAKRLVWGAAKSAAHASRWAKRLASLLEEAFLRRQPHVSGTFA